MNEIYLDHAATTNMSKEALQAMLPYLFEEFGNPSGKYSLGRRAQKGLEQARVQIADTLNCQPENIIFTSGGTESDNMAVNTAVHKKKSGHLLCSAIEHPAMKNMLRFLKEKGFDVEFIPCDENGIVTPEEVKKMLKPDTIFVSVMAANNEIGTIQPIREIAMICRERNIYFHTDAVQAYGHIKLDASEIPIDMLSASAHKFGGPKGIGFLYVSNHIECVPMLFGGGQEGGMRSGTENVASIVGMGKAAEVSCKSMEKNSIYEQSLRDYMIERIENEIPYARLNGSKTRRLSNNINMSFSYVEGKSLVSMLDMVGICCSGGSACSTHKKAPSEVLTAIGLSEQLANSAIRMTLSAHNTMDEMNYTLYHLKNSIKILRERNPAYQRFIYYNRRR